MLHIVYGSHGLLVRCACHMRHVFDASAPSAHHLMIENLLKMVRAAQVLIAKSQLFNSAPHSPGGGSVFYVTREDHRCSPFIFRASSTSTSTSASTSTMLCTHAVV